MLEKPQIEDLCLRIVQAGEVTLSIRRQEKLSTQAKADGSPVTCADQESQSIILHGLSLITPDIPVIAEEQVTQESLSHSFDTYWLVDPLDGTRDYITGRNDFSVNIGLIHNGIPVFGLVYAPARAELVYGGIGHGAFHQKDGQTTQIFQTPMRHTPPRLTISLRDAKKNPIDKWVANGIVSEALVHASAYKLAMVATTQADMFLRTSATYEWDTAAGDAILRALGGTLMTPDGSPLAYRKRGLENGSFLATCASMEEAKSFLSSAELDWPITKASLS